ncbi:MULTISPECIES: helix-turn-helix domain-containing protein [Pantoea]|jgi:SOS-response transcriptional repressor LexA|uniref:Helix-turn-helix domain-containing protein n=1 Tax=Pantoea vagans TaxID=470934 RepID=A0ABY3L9U4_9GAMM|nr:MULTISPECIES: helix-turn-helix domain-containing protein [Pantoea]ADO09958.1 LexA repressor [Pantoea vagans C9-1]PAW36179.1 XRE family transcriptional regulator [Pantoea vagans]PXW19150.1 SOS-response transcriptional repressor LexA [Pantoea sp. JKS000250]QPG28480.1 helix-turn-helix domain-containing protein [Pantoea sp. SM3640]TXL74740.1 helix-turn-helix domain-containing protein [Pantoea vagans]
MKNETLGDRIRLRRKSLQLTQKQLAQQVKVSHVAISQWEKEETLPRGENLLRLAEALGCTPAYLIDGDGPVFSENSWAGLHQIPLLSQRDVAQWLNDASSVRHELLMHNDMALSQQSFAIRVEEQAMTPAILRGDVVIIDPSLAPQPGDCVLAMQQQNALLRTWRQRGSEEGVAQFELAPVNINFPELHSSRDSLQLIGTLVELRRYRQP